MRLIDADELILHLNDFMLQQSPIDIQDIESIHVSAVIQDCINAVEEQPTAYDVDKVVEELERLKETEQNREDEGDEEGNGDAEQIFSDGESQGKFKAYIKAIKVVKAGGIDA